MGGSLCIVEVVNISSFANWMVSESIYLCISTGRACVVRQRVGIAPAKDEVEVGELLLHVL